MSVAITQPLLVECGGEAPRGAILLVAQACCCPHVDVREQSHAVKGTK